VDGVLSSILGFWLFANMSTVLWVAENHMKKVKIPCLVLEDAFESLLSHTFF
jgi:hypothetical protein